MHGQFIFVLVSGIRYPSFSQSSAICPRRVNASVQLVSSGHMTTMSVRITLVSMAILCSTANAKNTDQSILDDTKANQIRKSQITGTIFTVKPNDEVKTYFTKRRLGNTAKKSKGIIHLGSASKQLSGTAITYLEPKGKLRLSDRIASTSQ
jgi:CubicO group peptidase (beta-lactamase class C family)